MQAIKKSLGCAAVFATAIGLTPLALADEFVRERLEPKELYDHPAYTNLITIQGDSKMLFIAGQAPMDAQGQCVGRGDWRAQYVQMMENLKIALAAGGATFEDVVFIRRFVTDIDGFFGMMRNQDNPPPDYFQGVVPPSTLIEVTKLADACYLMEFDIIATVAADK